MLLSFGLFLSTLGLAQTQKHLTKGKQTTTVKKQVSRPIQVVKSPTVVAVTVRVQDSLHVIKADPINPNYKGPYGEVIYTTTDGRIYFIDKNDQRVYIELEK